ncbi:hypothetical protein K466DRAFT_607093 [Polyporus arcularius HHB13444]|uniref:Uncharacterized protein n=1 Tax=Polyporus arcularius HHB13444 TaxID=1314778 RepID=A0A5C3NM69_9APHY|nr:hypothetical protein K466DRAFT_607093 [Polyporus arcularius HHB13444]
MAGERSAHGSRCHRVIADIMPPSLASLTLPNRSAMLPDCLSTLAAHGLLVDAPVSRLSTLPGWLSKSQLTTHSTAAAAELCVILEETVLSSGASLLGHAGNLYTSGSSCYRAHRVPRAVFQSCSEVPVRAPGNISRRTPVSRGTRSSTAEARQ